MKYGFGGDVGLSLLFEQARVQADLYQLRGLGEYNAFLLPGQQNGYVQETEISAFLRKDLKIKKGVISVETILRSMAKKNHKDQALHWADMGAGYALAMHELALQNPKLLGNLLMTPVDLFDYNTDTYGNEYIEPNKRQLLAADACKNIVRMQSDIAVVELPAKADLITSVESIQYLDDPMGAICHWYNQLADGGYVMVAAAHDWGREMTYDGAPSNDTPAKFMRKALRASGIEHAVLSGIIWDNSGRPQKDSLNFSRIVIKKAPHTQIIPTTAPTDAVQGRNGYKTVSYALPSIDGLYPISVQQQ